MIRSTFVRLPAIAALAALLPLAGCSSGPPRTAEELRADQEIAAHVYAALKAAPLYYYPALEVSCNRGVVYLSGLVFSSTDFDAATSIARKVPGVTAVANAITVDAGR